MQRIVSFLLFLFLPITAWADGRVIPPTALPAHINIPDQRALICFSNGTERLVIETRFTGSGTNFAWVVPLPSQPVIEEATTGLFPTLQYLFRPRIIHNVPHYYLGILISAAVIVLLRLAKRTAIDIVIYALLTFMFLFLAGGLLPVAKRARMESVTSEKAVSVLNRKLVGLFEMTTISSHDTKALQTWLTENGYAMPANAEPVIADYVKDGWVFVATKVRRDKPDNETSTPHPLSFTFKTDKPVYPMRLTGVDNGPLSVELYIFSSSRAKAAHFKVASCTQLNPVHPLLHQWTVGLPVATKLTAKLSPAAMRHDVWLGWTPFEEKENRLFSRQGALTIALNWGAGLFATSLFIVWLLAFVSETQKPKFPRRIGMITLTSAILVGLVYLSLPKIEVKLVKGGYFRSYNNMREEQLALQIILEEEGWPSLKQARTTLQNATSNPTNAVTYGLMNWDNDFAGGQVREEDSPGNYLLRETSNQLQLVTFRPDGGEEISSTWNLPARH